MMLTRTTCFAPRWIGRCPAATPAARRRQFAFPNANAPSIHAANPNPSSVAAQSMFSWHHSRSISVEGVWATNLPRCRGGTLPETLSSPTLKLTHSSGVQCRFRSGRGRFSDRQTLEENVEVAYDHIDILSPRDVAAFWTVVSKIQKQDKRRMPKKQGGLEDRYHNNGRQMRQQFETILCHAMEEIRSYGFRDLAQTTLAFAKIVKDVGGEGKNMPNDSPRRILHDLMVGTNSEDKHFIFQQVAMASMPILEEFDPRHLSNFIYAFGLAGHDHEFEDGSTFFDMLALAAIPKLKRFNSQDLANMLLAYAYVGVSDSKLFKKAGDVIVWRGSLETFEEQHIANIMWAHAKVNERHPKLFKKVADHIMELGNLGGFNPQNLSNIVWAFATLNEPHPKLFQKVADHIVARNDLGGFNPQNLSNIMWAFATAKEFHPKLFKKVADHIMVLHNLGRFIPQDYSNIVWAYATAKESHPKLFQKVADHIMRLNDLRDFKPQALSNIAWAYATAKESHPALFQKLAEAAIQRKVEFNSQGVANFLWARAANGHLDVTLFQTLAPIAEARLDKCNAQELANIAWAFAVANVSATSLFNENFVKACKDREHEFSVENLRQLHQWQIWQEELKSHITLHPSLSEKCRKAFVSLVPRPSSLQDDVVSELKAMGLQPEEEVLTKRGYFLDAVVEVNGNKIGVEVDGPSHFLGRSPSGSTILKRRQVTNVEGLPIFSVPYWEWNKLKRDIDKKQKYLGSLLCLGPS